MWPLLNCLRRRRRKAPAAPASPGDILAGMVAARLLKDLPKPRVRPAMGQYGRRQDLARVTWTLPGGVVASAHLTDRYGGISVSGSATLTYGGERVILSPKAVKELHAALEATMARLQERQRAQRHAASERRALEAIADAMGVPMQVSPYSACEEDTCANLC